MTQILISEKFTAYLRIKAKKLEAEIANSAANNKTQQLIELQDHMEGLIKWVKDGLCFGFAVCDAVFDEFGYGEWWQEVLVRIANWDETDVNALDQEVDLSHLLPESHLFDDDLVNDKTLAGLFEKALNFIPPTHLAAKSKIARSFVLKGCRQENFLLNIDGLITINHEIKSIAERNVYAGYFTYDQLVAWLYQNKNIIANNICLVHSEDHTIKIKLKYENGHDVWILYDSNHDHKSIHTMTKKIYTTEFLAKNIVAKLESQSLAFEVASFHKNMPTSFSFYNHLTPEQAIELIQADGLNIIAINAPFVILKIIKLAHENTNTAQTLTQALIQALAHALTRQANDQSTGFHYLVTYAPQAIPGLLLLARQNRQIAYAIASALFYPSNPYNLMIMRKIAKKTPSAISDLLHLAAKYPAYASTVAFSLMHIDDKNYTGLHSLACHSPGSIVELLTLANDNENIALAIAKSLPSISQNNITALDIIYCNAGSLAMSMLLILAEKYECVANAFITALSHVSTNNSLPIINSQDRKIYLRELNKNQLHKENQKIAVSSENVTSNTANKRKRGDDKSNGDKLKKVNYSSSRSEGNSILSAHSVFQASPTLPANTKILAGNSIHSSKRL